MDPTKSTNWSIPRASLSSNSSTSSKSYNSSDSIRNYHRGSEVFEIDDSGKTQVVKNNRRLSDGPYSGHFSQSSLSSTASYYSDRDRIVKGRRDRRRSSSNGDIHLPKRGSRSSQGSTDSNHVSDHSISKFMQILNPNLFTECLISPINRQKLGEFCKNPRKPTSTASIDSLIFHTSQNQSRVSPVPQSSMRDTDRTCSI